jgi:hypothetical protein
MNNVSLSFLGDIFPANLDLTVGYGIANEFNKHNGQPWVNLSKIF